MVEIDPDRETLKINNQYLFASSMCSKYVLNSLLTDSIRLNSKSFICPRAAICVT